MPDLNPVDPATILVLILEFCLGRTCFLTKRILVRVCSASTWDVAGAPWWFSKGMNLAWAPGTIPGTASPQCLPNTLSLRLVLSPLDPPALNFIFLFLNTEQIVKHWGIRVQLTVQLSALSLGWRERSKPTQRSIWMVEIYSISSLPQVQVKQWQILFGFPFSPPDRKPSALMKMIYPWNCV